MDALLSAPGAAEVLGRAAGVSERYASASVLLLAPLDAGADDAFSPARDRRPRASS